MNFANTNFVSTLPPFFEGFQRKSLKQNFKLSNNFVM
jgi:hypothetical protein